MSEASVNQHGFRSSIFPLAMLRLQCVKPEPTRLVSEAALASCRSLYLLLCKCETLQWNCHLAHHSGRMFLTRRRALGCVAVCSSPLQVTQLWWEWLLHVLSTFHPLIWRSQLLINSISLLIDFINLLKNNCFVAFFAETLSFSMKIV